MNANQRQIEVDRLFKHALELEFTDRESYLAHECQDLPPDIMNNVCDLLRIDANSEALREPFSSPLKKCFVGESEAKFIRSRSRIAGISEDMPRFGNAELMNFDRSQAE